eukprot:1357895-Prorocentrum_lima.AAC.1
MKSDLEQAGHGVVLEGLAIKRSRQTTQSKDSESRTSVSWCSKSWGCPLKPDGRKCDLCAHRDCD